VDFSNIEKTKVDLFSHINIGYYIDKEETKGNIIYTTNLNGCWKTIMTTPTKAG
jgi:hypothetical protein